MEKLNSEKLHNDEEKIKEQSRDIKDYSAPLEWKEKEEKKLEEIESEIEKKLDTMQAEIFALELMEGRKVAASESDIGKQYERLNNARKEIQELKKKENLTKENIAMFLNTHKWMTNLLNDFKSGTEH
ncbi:MAG: hypothetical protein GXP44_00185 [bacterium]|nr:hypothetical protein [bacterium]